MGNKNRAMQTSAPTYKKMPSTAMKNTGFLSRPRLDPRLGGTSALVSFTFKKDTVKNVIAMRIKKNGNDPRQPILLKTANAAIAVTKYVDAALPIPFMPCAKLRLRLNAPVGLTSRMMGLPETCRNVVPTPRRKIQLNNSA